VRARDAEIAALGEQVQRFGATGERAAAGAIRAPIDGVVVKLDMVAGELVDPDRELLTIADLSTVWVQADVMETDLALVAPGQAAAIAVAGWPDRRFAGRVAYVADMLDPRTNTARVRCAVANPDGALKLNMFAAIEIAAPAGRDGVTVPPAALQEVDGKAILFVRRGPERFEPREVRPGVATPDWVEITAGVAAGETVVTDGGFQLKSVLLRDRIDGD
jgi:cobalt-zinc-cadmium efflux system membrane fusion protein